MLMTKSHSGFFSNQGDINIFKAQHHRILRRSINARNRAHMHEHTGMHTPTDTCIYVLLDIHACKQFVI